MQKNIWIAAKYLRLSIEDGDKAESESIVNQSILIDSYMKSTSDITIVETFKDAPDIIGLKQNPTKRASL